jgi:DNA-binding CsgD family transcriptional regulator
VSQMAFLKDKFDLTPAEVRLVLRLMEGDSLRSSAAALGIAYETARTALKSVFHKTRTCRQAELLIVIMKEQAMSPEASKQTMLKIAAAESALRAQGASPQRQRAHCQRAESRVNASASDRRFRKPCRRFHGQRKGHPGAWPDGLSDELPVFSRFRSSSSVDNLTKEAALGSAKETIPPDGQAARFWYSKRLRRLARRAGMNCSTGYSARSRRPIASRA